MTQVTLRIGVRKNKEENKWFLLLICKFYRKLQCMIILGPDRRLHPV